MKRTVTGIYAHVDSGKTTLSEAMLSEAGVLKKPGRVDRRDTFLDTDKIERKRGITVFSKQAVFDYGKTSFTLLDTPGHVDFSAETERTMQVLDAAVLLVSGSEGVQSHTVTLWQFLKRQNIPVFIFVNKMDISHRSREDIMKELGKKLSGRCADLSGDDFEEEAAAVDEKLMESYLESETLTDEELAAAAAERHLFPCFFGSALECEGVGRLLSFMDRLMPGTAADADKTAEDSPFGARVFKITHDPKGMRLTHMKIVSGVLHPRDVINDEKVSEIRIYSGDSYEQVRSAGPGIVCAVCGLENTEAGEGLGSCRDGRAAETKPVLSYRVDAGENDIHKVLSCFRILAEEDPALAVRWDEDLSQISVSIMGQVQLEILKSVLLDRFGIDIGFDKGSILYKETIRNTVEGVGHYEPLRHYAEVHLILSPLPRNSGMQFDSDCSEDLLDSNWQNLIMTHLLEKQHSGVLTGSPVTDMKITLVSGMAHKKHTEGGDFRQATYRAVRNGLMKAESILLEPWYRFNIAVPSDFVGRTMADIKRMGGTFEAPSADGDMSLLLGRVPVSEMREYPAEIAGYTKGRGQISLVYDGYDECHDAQTVIEETGYDPARDVENTGDSVFCEHGSGFVVSWDRVEKYMHLESALKKIQTRPESRMRPGKIRIDEKEAAEVARRAGGAPREKRHRMKKRTESPKITKAEARKRKAAAENPKEEIFVVDGYNLIFAKRDRDKIGNKDLSGADLDAMRDGLVETLENYAGYKGRKVIVVFDAYKRKDAEGSSEKRGDLTIVYTAFEQTADSWIEKFTHENQEKYRIRVITSDALEQMIAMGHGAMRISSREFLSELDDTRKEILDKINSDDQKRKI